MSRTLGNWLETADIDEKLRQVGLSEHAAQIKHAALRRVMQALSDAGVSQTQTVYAFWVPGRIEVLGKHTDYGGGRTLIAAVDKGFMLAAAPRTDKTVTVYAPDRNDKCSFELSPDLTPTVGHWSNYPMTVGRRLMRNFGPLKGADIAFVSDLPPAAGMSSSSAFMIGIYRGLAAVNTLTEHSGYRQNISDNESLAGYLATIENGQNFGTLLGDKGVGTFGGSEDHTAILCCQPGKMSQYSYCPVQFERTVPMPAGYVFAIASSGVIAEKTGAAREKYNLASLLARRVAEIWREQTGKTEPHLAAILASSPGAGDCLRDMLGKVHDPNYSCEALLKRLEHFRSESVEIIPAAGDALLAGDTATFGRFVDLSQALAESLLGTQVPPTITLAKTARELGAAAASAFGAGYGGSVWAMVEQAQADTFLKAWEKGYAKAFSEHMAHAAFFTTSPGPAACQL